MKLEYKIGDIVRKKSFYSDDVRFKYVYGVVLKIDKRNNYPEILSEDMYESWEYLTANIGELGEVVGNIFKVEDHEIVDAILLPRKLQCLLLVEVMNSRGEIGQRFRGYLHVMSSLLDLICKEDLK